MTTPVPIDLCKAPGVNYNLPHVPVQGEYDGLPRVSCKFCGRWLTAPGVGQ